MIEMMWSNHTDRLDLQPLLASLQYLEEVLSTRLGLAFERKTKYKHIGDIPPPIFDGSISPFVDFVEKSELTRDELIVLLLALAPHIQPDFFDQLIARELPESGDFPQLGGVRGKQHRGFLPTGETVYFVLAGTNLNRRFEVQNLFSDRHFFSINHILWLEEPKEEEPASSGKLLMNTEFVSLFTLGRFPEPKFSLNFPAKRVTTEMEWEDLVLNPKTMLQVQELQSWLHHGNTLLYEWGMKKRIKPGFRALFYGPPGTGKTLTAGLIGKYTGREVFKVDLSMVVSKFIGETEKNLAKLFSRAENKGWVLFFDEADSLFGKRTNVRDAHDKYANQEVSYLLQRVEDYDGLVILASNFKSNIDEAFMRRFQAVIHFPMPSSSERDILWQKAIPAKAMLENGLDLTTLARKYEITGSSIINVVQYASLKALARNEKVLLLQDFVDGIRREFSKEGKVGK